MTHRLLPPGLLPCALALAVGMCLLFPTGLQAQQLSPEQAEEQGREAVPTQPDPDRVQSGQSLRGTDGVIFVPEWGDDRVMALDAATGDLLDENFIVDPDHLSSPKHAIANFDGDGIFVSDQIEDVVYEYDLDGNYVGIFAPAGGVDNSILDNVRGIRIAPDGETLWVTVAGGANSGGIAEFDMDGNYLGNFIEPGTGGLDSPWSIHVRDGDILISDSGTDGIYRFDLDGVFLDVWSDAGINFPQQLNPGGKNVLAAGFSSPSGAYEYLPDGTQDAVYDVVTGLRGVYELPSGNLLVSNGSGVHEVTRDNALVRTVVAGSGQFFERVGEGGGGTSSCDGLDFCEDFEEGIPGDWTIFANEFSNETTAWQAVTEATLGNVVESTWSFDTPDGEVAEDYLATPQLTLGTGALVQFDAAQEYGQTEYGSEYEVLVSTGSPDDPADYTMIASYVEDDFPDSEDGAMNFTVDLSAYAGESVYIAFLHRGSNSDTWFLDNVGVDLGEPIVGGGELTFDPSPLVEQLLAGETGTETVTVTNTTGSDIAFDFSQYSGGDRPGRDVAPPTSGEPSLELGKGDFDPRGYAQAFGEGGPDAFGYTWIDSDEPGGPAYDFVDISGTGTELTEADFDSEDCTFDPLDEGNALVELPFAFPFYGESYSSVKVNINGHLNFNADGAPIPCSFTNDPMPDTGTPNGGLIAPLWDDFNAEPEGPEGGQIFYEALPDGRFVVQYHEIERFGTAGDGFPNTFQVILSPSGVITYQYGELTDESPSYTIGIENPDGTDGLEVAMGSGYATEGLAVQISAAPPFVTGVEPATGTVPAGGSVDVEVAFDATSLNGGTYEGTLLVETDLATEPSVFELPVVLEVTGEAACVLALDPAAFGEVIVGNTAEATATVTNDGSDACELTSASADGPFSVEGFEATTVAPGAETSFTVVYTPTEAGSDTGTLTVETDGADLTAALSGEALGAPTPEVDPTSLAFAVEVGDTDSGSFTLSNVGGEDAADLEYEVSVVAARPAGSPAETPDGSGLARSANDGRTSGRVTLGDRLDAARSANASAARFDAGFARADGTTHAGAFETPDHGPLVSWREGGVTITHSASQEIVDLTGVSCGVAGSHTSPNSFWRVFDLAEFDLGGGLDVTSVDVGVESVNGSDLESAVRLYTLDGDFTMANLTLVGEADFTLAGGTALELVNVPVEGTFDADDVLVVEWYVGDGEPTFTSYYPGANGAGQTGPTYISSEDCAITEPTDYADIGFPDVHWVMNVNGESGPGLVTVSPDMGSIAPGGSDEITVSVNATDAEPGTYEYQVLIATNDPATPTLVVDVTVVVAGVSTEDGAVPTEFVVDQNYPNPFASATTIEYGLPEAARVTVEVYDAVGRHVATLVDDEQAAGYHEARWEAGGVASGVYLYRIQAGDHTRTMKMVVVR